MAMRPRAQVPAFALLQDRNFFVFWLVGSLVAASRRLELLTLSLFVLGATDSHFQLGLVWVFHFIPRPIFSPLAGVIADRFNRQRILMVAQGLNVLIAASILLLFAGDLIQPWHAFLAAFMKGVTRSLDDPSRRAGIFDIVGAGRLVNAMSLDSISFTAGKMAGPILGGVLVGTLGFTAAFVGALVVQSLALGALSRVWIPAYRGGAPREPVGRSLLEGVRYALHSPMLIGLLYVTVVVNALALPVEQFIPAVGRDLLGIGPVLVGLLVAADGFGRLAAAGIMASTQGPQNQGRVFAVGSLMALLAVLLFAWSPWYALSFALLAIGGIGAVGFATMQSSIAMLWAPQEMRGRMIGLTNVSIGVGNPLGALAIGGLAAAFNIQWAIAVSAAVGLLLILPAMVMTPLVRQTSTTPPQATA